MEFSFHIGWPQGIFIFLTILGIGISIARYGEQKSDRFDLFDVAISPALMCGLLYWGGFFG